MKIDFVSDVACPWCAVGLNSLERALEQLGAGVDVELHFRPFELNPQMPPEGEDAAEHLARKYGLTPQQLERNRAAIPPARRRGGLRVRPPHAHLENFDAHRLLYRAGLEARQVELEMALAIEQKAFRLEHGRPIASVPPSHRPTAYRSARALV